MDAVFTEKVWRLETEGVRTGGITQRVMLLKLESPFFTPILGASITATFYLTLPYGILRGKQQFIGLGGANIATRWSDCFRGLGSYG